jgi:hypothetical protein
VATGQPRPVKHQDFPADDSWDSDVPFSTAPGPSGFLGKLFHREGDGFIDDEAIEMPDEHDSSEPEVELYSRSPSPAVPPAKTPVLSAARPAKTHRRAIPIVEVKRPIGSPEPKSEHETPVAGPSRSKPARRRGHQGRSKATAEQSDGYHSP